MVPWFLSRASVLVVFFWNPGIQRWEVPCESYLFLSGEEGMQGLAVGIVEKVQEIWTLTARRWPQINTLLLQQRKDKRGLREWASRHGMSLNVVLERTSMLLICIQTSVVSRSMCLSSPGLYVPKVSGYAGVLLVATFVLGIFYETVCTVLFALCPRSWWTGFPF